VGNKVDLVNAPPHYTEGEIECKDGIKAALRGCKDSYMGWCLGNTIKYIWRFALKGNPLQDLKKASFYLTEAIGRYEELYTDYGNLTRKK
jgi:hypothetical protein